MTDPHNVGAALRSAAAFGAKGLVMTQRHSPPLGGVLAKSASGALDLVPIVQVRNLAEALAELGERGITRLGLAEEADQTLEDAPLTFPLALVLGAGTPHGATQGATGATTTGRAAHGETQGATVATRGRTQRRRSGMG